MPVVRGLAGRVDVPISVDTTKAEVARQALAAGAAIVNDITAGLGDPDMMAGRRARPGPASCSCTCRAPRPRCSRTRPTWTWSARSGISWPTGSGPGSRPAFPAERIAIDPGIGFGKTSEHNRLLLAHLDALSPIGRPVLLGVSRKGFLGRLTGRPVTDRLPASLAAACFCVTRGTAHILRVHDVAATTDAAKVLGALLS